jgi:hypothetical protein
MNILRGGRKGQLKMLCHVASFLVARYEFPRTDWRVLLSEYLPYYLLELAKNNKATASQFLFFYDLCTTDASKSFKHL